MPPADQPYLALVVSARNDNHGGDFTRRMQAFLNGFHCQCHSHQVPAEVIVVEWNPPADRPPLAEALEWPIQTPWCRVRFIQVPPELHARYKYASQMGLYQMIAKNVGIRRTNAEWILATNIDILFNDDLMRFIAARRFEKGRMYRMDRYDAGKDVPLGPSVTEQLAYCDHHILRVHYRHGSVTVKPAPRAMPQAAEKPEDPLPNIPPPPEPSAPPEVVPAQPLGFADRAALWMRTHTPRLHALLAPGYRLLTGRPVVVVPPPLIQVQVVQHEAPATPLVEQNSPPPKAPVFEPLHTNGCGDFTLVHRDDWLDLRGYPEFDAFSMNIDSVFCYAAHYAGVTECILENPMRIYHIEHSSGWTPEGNDALRERIARAGIPWIEYTDVMSWAHAMARLERPFLFNRDDWGLRDETLAETVIGATHAESAQPTG